MSSDKNPEVVGCDASIMRNVWEIREREYNQKVQQEEERVSKSALTEINKDWANRLAARLGGYKRVERKPRSVEPVVEEISVPKPKRAPIARVGDPVPTPTRRPAPPPRPTPAQAKGKKGKEGKEQTLGKKQLLMSLTKTLPSPMAWGKSWRFSKDLPQQEQSEVPPSWGECWMFASLQPFTEAGQPWPNGPCKINPAMLHLLDKPVFRVPDEEALSWDLCNDEWDGSWKKAIKENTESTSEEEVPSYGFFTTLVESHRHNNDLYSSEWNDGWKSTKPSENEDMAVAKTPEKEAGLSSEWADCWKLCNHHGLIQATEVREHHSPEWSNSWSVATAVQVDHTGEGSGGKNQGKEFGIVDKNKAHLFFELDEEFHAISEWSASWQVNKNDTQPTPEIEKTLKTKPPKIEQPEDTAEEPISEQEAKFLQLKASVLFRPRREVTHCMLLRLKDLEKASTPEWKDSWKILRHQLRASPRQKHVQVKSFDEEKQKEWKDSWKCSNSTLGQTPEMWEQEWTTTPQFRVDRAREHNHFAPVDLPKNGPKGEPAWNESWRMSRRQLDPTATPASPSTFWQPGQQIIRAPGDWQDAWRVSETQHHHDKPSYAQWVQAWRSSAFQNGTYHSKEWQAGTRWLTKSLEIQAKKEIISVQCAEKKMFHDEDLDKVWADSWKAESMLKKGEAGESSEYGSKWGMSFRLANPMPKLEQPWLKSFPNMCYYAVVWSKHKNNRKYYINSDFTNNPRVSKLWGTSQQFLQIFSGQLDRTKLAGQPRDPRVILTKHARERKQLYTNLERKEKQPDKRWAGCHLLGKTQPKPKRGGVKKVKLEMDDGEEKFEEMWAESWKFLVRPGSLRNKAKSLKGWEEAWKMLFPPYETLNGPRAK